MKLRPQTAVLPDTHEFKTNVFSNNKDTFPSLCACMCHKSDKGFMSLEQHGTSMKGCQPVSSLRSDRNSQLEIMERLFPYHAAWDECNKQVHHQPKTTQPGKSAPPPQKNKQRNQSKHIYMCVCVQGHSRNRTGQRHVVLSPQISGQHISLRPRTCLWFRSDSALTCTCMLLPLSPICQSSPSLMGKK